MRSFLLLAVLGTLILLTVWFWSYIRYPYSLHSDVSKYPFQIKGGGGEGGLQAENGDQWVVEQETAEEFLKKSDVNSTPTLYDVTRPFHDNDFECIRTITKPSIAVCLFNIWRDVFISRSLKSAGIWEIHIVNEFVEAVARSDENTGVSIGC